MLEVKLFEVRDHATFIPAVGIRMEAEACEGRERTLLRRAGYSPFGIVILLTRADGSGPAHYDPYAWPNRTMQGAHLYIERNWNSLKSGDLVDARVGLGETETPCESELDSGV